MYEERKEDWEGKWKAVLILQKSLQNHPKVLRVMILFVIDNKFSKLVMVSIFEGLSRRLSLKGKGRIPY